ncbi:MAG: FKBP-type peptidyl-prolyl cis-trans isomerase [Bacteroidaceae bacterium]|nr:FKBP-type peptidyl-prolyl cis-trans isomerase [Bacteroidaceae bacterium]MBR3633255.1 FKBP-type peptidyl-prolyl cis-trans isomerase [Bacteroidaceae bacterium]
MDKVSYALGLGIGHQLKAMGGNKLVIDDLAQAIKDVINDATTQMDIKEAQIIASNFMAEVEEENKKKREEIGAMLKVAGEQFLADNAKNESVVVLPSGLQYEVLTEGSGRKPKATDNVKCHYEGRLIDGTVFDSSYRRGTPAVFGLNQVIAGWTEGVQLMQEGAKYRFFIPYNLAYGANGAGDSIPPYSALIFEVELISIE